MTNAVKVMKRILEEEYGFKHILCVFSGRRGVHIWVCDKRARLLRDDERKAIVAYLSFSKVSQKINLSLQYFFISFIYF
jgi:DNA primase small subunit